MVLVFLEYSGVSSRLTRQYLSAAIVHDYLTDIVIEKKSITFRSVDNTFKEMLIDLNVNKIEVKVLYWSVRLYHLLRYGD